MSTPDSGISRAQRTRWAIGIVLLVLPMVVLTSVPSLSGAGGLLNLGILCAVAGFSVNGAAGIAAAIMTPALVLVGLYASGVPWLGTVIMVGLAVGFVWAARRGLVVAAVLVISQVALALVLAPFVGDGPASDEQSALVVAGLMAFGALWGALIGSVFLHGMPRRTPDFSGEPFPWDHAVAVLVLVGLTTAVAMAWLAQTDAWWIVLLLLVLLAPYGPESQNAMIARTATTIGMALIAALVAELLPYPAFTTFVGVILLVVALASYLSRPFWMVMMVLAVAVIFLGFDRQVTVGAPSQRIAVVVLGALALMFTTLLAQLVLRRRSA